MFSLLLSFFLVTSAATPNETMQVYAREANDIYVADPVVEGAIHAENLKNAITTYANMHHMAFYRRGSVNSVYDERTLHLLYPSEDCDYKTTPITCASEDGLWTLKTYAHMDTESASITMMLYDDDGVIIGQSSIVNKKRVHIIPRKKITSAQQSTGNNMSAARGRDCSTGNSCKIQNQSRARGQRRSFSMYIDEDLKPTVITTPPSLNIGDISQTVMMLYLSIH